MTIAVTSSATDRRTNVSITGIDSDTGLIRRYLNGDARAFEILFKKYQTPIFNLVSRMVNGEDAYDLTQDVFCNALRGLLTSEASPSSRPGSTASPGTSA